KSALSALRGCSGVTWEIDASNVYDQLSAIYCGDYADIARSAPTLVDEALRRGRVWKGAMLRGFSGMPAWLTTGDGAQYRRQRAPALDPQLARQRQPEGPGQRGAVRGGALLRARRDGAQRRPGEAGAALV